MNQTCHRHALAVIAVLCTGLVAQDSRTVELKRSIPFLGDLPILDYRRQLEEKAWLALGESTMLARIRFLESFSESRPAPVPEQVGPRERWIMDLVRSRFQGLSAVETVERATVRNDGVNRTVTSEMGVEVRGSRETVGKVQTFFDRFTAGSRKVVTIELRVLSADEAQADAATAAAVASRQDYEKRLKEFAATPGSRTSFHSPTIKVFANQTAQASMLEQVGYIKDFKVTVVGDQKIADPVVGVVNEGFEMELTPLYDPDGGILIISGHIGFSHVVRPIPKHRVRIGETEAMVQLPSVRSNRWSGDLKLEPGQDTFKITGLKHSPRGLERDQDLEVWCLVTLEDEDGGGPKGEIVDRDEKNGNVYVAFPREAVPDEPWAKAPKSVSVYRGEERIGTARLAGGWVLGAVTKHPVITIYQLAPGTPRDGDSVR